MCYMFYSVFLTKMLSYFLHQWLINVYTTVDEFSLGFRKVLTRFLHAFYKACTLTLK